MTAEDIIDDILRREGGWTDHPADRGGPTNKGITMPTLAEWRGRPITEQDLRDLTEKEAREIYHHQYITAPGFLHIWDDRLRALVVDSGVLSGPATATKALQRAVRVRDDGIFGPETKRALSCYSRGEVYGRMLAERMRFFGRLISNDSSQSVFAAGWLNRLAEFVEMT